MSIETVLTRAACVYAWFCMRVPAQPAPTTRTTTDPWSSGSTVVIFQVRDSDGFDLKGMGLCLSLCMRIVRACLLLSLSTRGSMDKSISVFLTSVPSLSCLDKSISV